MAHLTQTPAPGTYVQVHRGDIVHFSLRLSEAGSGDAWLRTNLGRGKTRRREVVRHIDEGTPILARDWHDLPMRRVSETEFALALPALEVGCFEAKAFLLSCSDAEPVWPAGENVCIKTQSASTCGANLIYKVFVRQFGSSKCRVNSADDLDQAVGMLEDAGYAVIPRSGTFHDVINQLDVIMDRLGFRILQLLPIHPIPTTYARMGRFGSPFAVLDFMGVDPALAEFNRKRTPMDQFREFLDAVHARAGRVLIDIPVNHTGWASLLQEHHPEWFRRGEDRTFKSPGAWGVTWEDLSELDYAHVGLWRYMADVFLFWCRHGVDGFRCDAGYMIPHSVWEYIVAKVRLEYPDTIFLLEGLGGKLAVVEHLLAHSGLDWAYSELFQNYDRGQIGWYLPDCLRASISKGTLVHFAETHDNNRLAARSHLHARLRTDLSAMCSDRGAFGVTNGVEWYATEKVDVHGASSLNWGHSENQVAALARVNDLLMTHPAFYAGADIRVVASQSEHCFALGRWPADDNRGLLVLANLCEEHADWITWSGSHVPDLGTQPVDLLSGQSIDLDIDGDSRSCELAAGQVLCLSRVQWEALDNRGVGERNGRGVPERVREQVLRAKALDVVSCFKGEAAPGLDDVSTVRQWVAALAEDPVGFCAAVSGAYPPPVTRWRWPHDMQRTVMVPPGQCLCVEAEEPFRVEVIDGERTFWTDWSVPRSEGGGHFALMLPVGVHKRSRRLSIRLKVYGSAQRSSESTAEILLLSADSEVTARTRLSGADVRAGNYYALLTNGRGGMSQVRAAWGAIDSQYDALLAANLHPAYPVDRRVLFTRCRAWLVCRGYSQAIDMDCLEAFWLDADVGARWRFAVATGGGTLVRLDVALTMVQGQNTIQLAFHRRPAGRQGDSLPDDRGVHLILRPDIEDRCCHEITKAYAGAEEQWPRAIAAEQDGFCFSPPSGARLEVRASVGEFVLEPEWTYMVAHPFEADRGLAGGTDLFSPGYLNIDLAGGETVTVTATTELGLDAGLEGTSQPAAYTEWADPPREPGIPLADALRKAMRQFVVKRDDSLTVIAGYPWFLDWGRDTLICLRGMIAAGWHDECRDVLRQFARFEAQGTLPNMIRGGDDSNRDTSDAPLWLFVACADLLAAEEQSNLLSMDCDGRELIDVLRSLASSIMAGTPNGIVMDPESGLIYSPSHYTWMDTNHPAGTPRAGYPIEIQALWHSALSLLARVDSDGAWAGTRELVQASILRFFGSRQEEFLSDCLHAAPGIAAVDAVPDDALRSNQLFAVTLGAVTDRSWCLRILQACSELLVPGGLRSLADRPVEHPVPVQWGATLLNDPQAPYWGEYRGDEDTRRKPAYHNGTAWTWTFPSYPEALFMVHGDAARSWATALLASGLEFIDAGCVGHVPEVADGNAPHTWRGCGAQAWGATELYRVWQLVTSSEQA